MNKIVITLVLLMAGSAPAMQHQRQRDQDSQQQTQQKKKDKKKPNQQDNNNTEQPIADPENADLHAMLATIMNQINQAHGSVTNMVETLKHKEHQRICPTCGQHAELCPTDKDRIAHGNVMLCGCPICGGLLV